MAQDSKSDKRALVVGVDTYDMQLQVSNLLGAVDDATKFGGLLETHHDGGPNWDVTLLVSEDDDDRQPRAVGRRTLNDAIDRLFDVPAELDPDRQILPPTVDLLFYFSGHALRRGTRRIALCARDGESIDLSALMIAVGEAHAKSVTIILDCCFSGIMGADLLVPENVTILTASRSDQTAREDTRRGGLFSDRLLGGLRGAAGDLLGTVTPLSLYAHASGAFAEGHQRPTFRSNSIQPVVLRRAEPHVPIERLTQLTTIFRSTTAKVHLTMAHEGDKTDPAYTNRRDPHRLPYTGTVKQVELDHLKAYRDAHLVASDDGRDFWFLCADEVWERKTVSLTPLGEYFWELTKAGLLGTVSDDPAA